MPSTRHELRSRGRATLGRLFPQTDLGNCDDTRAFVREAVEALGGLEIHVHSASGFGDASLESWLRTLEIDLMAAVRGIEVALPGAGGERRTEHRAYRVDGKRPVFRTAGRWSPWLST